MRIKTLKQLDNMMASINSKQVSYTRDCVTKQDRKNQIRLCDILQRNMYFIIKRFTDDYHGQGSCNLSILSFMIQAFLYDVTHRPYIFTYPHVLRKYYDIDKDESIEAWLPLEKHIMFIQKYSYLLNHANCDELASYLLGHVIIDNGDLFIVSDNTLLSRTLLDKTITIFNKLHLQWNPAGIHGIY